jgi:UDP-N-acetylmuramoyl-L-alanyl-D-glutamate--2,6-diaminopimelate ligase
MEVSSHALALGRVDDVTFSVAGLTNITRDHLDFHGTFDAYVAAKRRLFDLAPQAVLNLDDAAGRDFAAALPHASTYAIEREAELRATNVRLSGAGSTFDAGGALHVEVALPGRFNVANALCAIGCARALHVADDAIRAGLAAVPAVPGRMERIAAGGIEAIVDYAHTPDALENVLRAARETTQGRLIVVVGCGGDRDAGKRPLMGEIAERAADVVIVTDDNPRSEPPASIRAQILAAAPHAREIGDRAQAIRAAIAMLREGDALVIAGKGHETGQIVGARTLPFSDADEARAALAEAA